MSVKMNISQFKKSFCHAFCDCTDDIECEEFCEWNKIRRNTKNKVKLSDYLHYVDKTKVEQPKPKECRGSSYCRFVS